MDEEAAGVCNFWCQVLPSFFEGLGIAVGVVAGIVAGTVITILVNKKANAEVKTHAVRALKFELEYNINKVDEFLNELNRYKASVIEGHVSMSQYFGFFRFSDIFNAASVQLYQNGFLAKHLTIEQVAKLQDAIYALSVSGQQFLNSNVEKNRVEATVSPENWEVVTKQRALNEIRYWEDKFQEHKSSFQDVIESL